jgi:hypothetical protein
MINIGRASFRANPRYALVVLDRLSCAERRLDGGAAGETNRYGVLRPQPGSGLEIRSASADTALLFLTLAEPGPLPEYFVARLGDEVESAIGRLVLDGVLEIEHKGQYLCGIQAAGLVARGPSDAGRGRIGELSRAALRYGQELVGLGEYLLALRLYGYGYRPVVTELERQLDNGAAMAAYLGLDPGGSTGELLDASWYERSPRENGERSNWRVWRPRRVMPREPDPAGPGCKLYVSPAMHELKNAIGAVASSLATARGLRAFKVGADVRGICRPDKLIVYFDRLEDLKTGADTLLEQLAGCPAHGVPFTAEISPDGLLSWGADPAARAFADRVDGTSWRMWVTQRLAEYLTVAGHAEGGTLEPWKFALERLRLSGIDTDTWVPASGMWAQAFATS